MKRSLLIISILLMTNSAIAKTKYKCRKGRNLVTCDGVEGAKRKAFCFKGEITKEKKTRFCQKEAKAKK